MKCLEQSCVEKVTLYKQSQLCSKHYQSKMYRERYKATRIVLKYCSCGQVAKKQSRLQLCEECARKHNRQRKIAYQLDRKKNHLPTKLRENLKSRLKDLFRKPTKTSIVKYLGCSIAELKIYLESKFLPGMSWDNYGLHGWHIDHIKPVNAFSEEEIFLASHYANLQPLWAEDNLKKGSTYVK